MWSIDSDQLQNLFVVEILSINKAIKF